MQGRFAALIVVACVLAAPATAAALPGDAPFGPIAPAQGASLPVDPDAIGVTYSCPTYRVADDGFIPLFGGPAQYGVMFSRTPTPGADGRLADGVPITGLRDTTVPDTCRAGLGVGGPPPRMQETPGRYYWQVYRICTGCPGSYEVSEVRSFDLVSPVQPALSVPLQAYDGYPFFVSLALKGAANGTQATIERKGRSTWLKVATASASQGVAEAVVKLARGEQQLRAVVTIGSQRLESPVKRVEVKRARNWSTKARDDGRYTSSGGLQSVKFKIAKKGRELRDFNAKVPMLCPGIVAGQFTTQIGTAIIKRVKIAPDGRFVGAATPGGDTAIRLRGRLSGRKASEARIELSVGDCSGSQGFTALRRGG